MKGENFAIFSENQKKWGQAPFFKLKGEYAVFLIVIL